MSIALLILVAGATGFAVGRWYVVALAGLLAVGATALLASPAGVADSPLIFAGAVAAVGAAVGVTARRSLRPSRG